MTRKQKLKNFITWLLNFKKCKCSFYCGTELGFKCSNCGGRVK